MASSSHKRPIYALALVVLLISLLIVFWYSSPYRILVVDPGEILFARHVLITNEPLTLQTAFLVNREERIGIEFVFSKKDMSGIFGSEPYVFEFDKVVWLLPFEGTCDLSEIEEKPLSGGVKISFAQRMLPGSVPEPYLITGMPINGKYIYTVFTNRPGVGQNLLRLDLRVAPIASRVTPLRCLVVVRRNPGAHGLRIVNIERRRVPTWRDDSTLPE